MDTSEKLRNAMLFNILSYMSNALIGNGNSVAAIDELYLFLSNLTTIEYIRNCMKRVRKWGKIPCIEYIEEAEETELTEAGFG